VSAGARPAALLRRAIAAGRLAEAEKYAKELEAVGLTEALELVLLMQRARDRRYERAATRWLGRLLAERPQVGLEAAAEMADALAGLDGITPGVSRSRLALQLERAGVRRASEIVARGPSS
jgi:hypothetical protein